MLLRFQHRSDVPEKQPDMRFSKRRKLYANPPRDSSCQYTALLDTFNSHSDVTFPEQLMLRDGPFLRQGRRTTRPTFATTRYCPRFQTHPANNAVPHGVCGRQSFSNNMTKSRPEIFTLHAIRIFHSIPAR